jgi:hypothetical protein
VALRPPGGRLLKKVKSLPKESDPKRKEIL